MKSEFVLKDILREKQNHIEQLLIERDIDKQDTENQALHFQKDIKKVGKYRILNKKKISTRG